MCGLVGAMGYLNEPDKKIFTTLFLTNVLRGTHGCGLTYLFEEGDKGYFDHVKSTSPSSTFIHSKKYNEVLNNNLKCIMGHSRFATKGEIKADNNHPFKTKNLLGMHNGTIEGKFQNSDKFETDSEGIFNLIDELGLKEALDIIHKEANSVAYALVYYDNRDASVNIIRNSARPLFVAGNNFGRMFWASDRDMLEFAIKKGSSSSIDIFSLEVGTYLKMFPFEVYDKRVEIKKNFYTPPSKPTTKYVYNYGKGTGHWNGNRWVENKKSYHYSDYDNYQYGIPDVTNKVTDTSKTNTNNTAAAATAEKKTKETEEVAVFKIGRFQVNEKQLTKVLEKGCAICGEPQALDADILKAKFFRKTYHDFICHPCLSNHTDNELKINYGISPDYDLASIEEVDEE